MHFITENSEMGKFTLHKIFLAIRLYIRLIIEILTYRPMIVYFNMATYGFALFRDFLVVFIIKILNYKIIIHLRTQLIDEQSKVSRLKRYLFRKAFANTTLICLSKNLAKDVLSVYSATPLIVNNGIDLLGEGLSTSNRQHITFLFLSNFLKTKGIFELLETAKSLKVKSYKFRLVIAGKDADISGNEITEYISNHNLEDVVEFIGPVYGKDKISVYQNSDVFVLPTSFEAFPGVILEAMQFGLPVISTIEGAIPEIVKDKSSGILINKGNKKELLKAMEYFLLNPDQIEIYGKIGVNRFGEKYTLQKFELGMIEAFNSTLNNN